MNETAKENRFLVNLNSYTVHVFKTKMEKNKPLYDELIRKLNETGIKISSVKTLNLNTSNPIEGSSWTTQQINDWTELAIQYYLTESGIKADWMTTNEKLESIKRLDVINRIKELFSIIEFPLLYGNDALLEQYIDDYLKQYVFHPKSVELAKRIFRIADELKELKVEPRLIDMSLRRYGYHYSNNIIVNGSLEEMAEVKDYDNLSIQNSMYNAFKKSTRVVKAKPIKIKIPEQSSNKTDTNKLSKVKGFLGVF